MARVVADVIYVSGERREKRFALLERIGVAAHHDGQRGRFGTGGTAAHGRAEDSDVAVFQTVGDAVCRPRRRRGQIDQYRSRFERVLKFIDDRVHGVWTGKRQKHGVSVLRNLFRTVGTDRAGRDEVGHRAVVEIVDGDLVAGVEEMLYHWVTHVTETDESQYCHGLYAECDYLGVLPVDVAFR